MKREPANLSRRGLLVGAVAVPAALYTAGEDAELLALAARACERWGEYVASFDAADRLLHATYRHPDFSRPRGFTARGRAEFDAVAERTGYRAACATTNRCRASSEAAIAAAFAVPARTVRGHWAKLALAVAVAKDATMRDYLGVRDEFGLVDRALEELRTAAGA